MLTLKDYIFGAIVAVLLTLCGALYFVNTSLDAKVKKYEAEKAENAGAAKQSAHEANTTSVRIQ